MTITSESCGEDATPGFGPEDFTVHTFRWEETACALVEMPQPQGLTECHFAAALVGLKEPPEDVEDWSPSVRFFTLEKGLEFSGETRTVLCEWTS